MIKLKKLVLVLAGGDALYDRQEISCRETWANPSCYGEDTRVFFVRGNPKDESEEHRLSKTTDELYNSSVVVNELSRTVTVDVPDGTRHLLFKCILAMNALKCRYDWEYFVRPNSGSYVNLNVLDESLNRLPKSKLVYAQENQYNGCKYPSGACFTMTKDLTDLLLQNDRKIIDYQRNTGQYDDVLLGLFLRQDITIAPRIDITYDRMMGTTNWFDPSCYHYYFMHSKNENPHYIVHNMFMGSNRR